MSAFIVDKATMDYVVTAISERRSDVSSPASLDQAGRNLYELNYAAICVRYGCDRESAPGPVDQSDIHSHYRYSRPRDYSTIRAVKSAHCLRYQCSEGDVVERPDFKQLCDVIAMMSDDIVRALPEYNAAPWGAV